MHQKGLVKITVDDKDRFLKIGTLSSAIFCELEGIKIIEMQDRLMDQRPFTLINFIFAGASAYSRLSKEEIDYTVDDVSLWLDQCNQDELVRLITAAMGTFEEKKSKPSQATKRMKR